MGFVQQSLSLTSFSHRGTIMNQYLETLQDKNAPLGAKIEASVHLWNEAHESLKAVQQFKDTLSEMSSGSPVRTWRGDGGTKAVVTAMPQIPKVDTYQREDLVALLGEEIYDQYIAESRTLRYSLVKEAPQEVLDLFQQLPCKPAKSQVKFYS